MLTVEALEVLALRPGATPSEIKEAYRDLVKVWHPDRFGSDLRLREKAELQLKRINEAYRVLQSNSDVDGRYTSGSESAASSSPRYASSSRSASSASQSSHNARFRWNFNGVHAGWIYMGLGVVVFLLASYFFIERALMQGTGSSPASVEQSQPSQEASRDGKIAHSTDLNGAEVRPSAGRSKDPGSSSFSVRSLSEVEMDRLQTLCSPQRELRGQVAYRWCLKAQLDLMTNPAGKPDLSALNEAERESIESVCSAAGRLHGQDRYNRCETEQVASLAAETARPDLSTLNDADRHSIESACANAKNREGPAAYNRCLERFMKALAEAK